ncbi:TetR/AcrR family transcriptional regulator [Amycolatopsis sp. NPDC098790]|uniref:TetR/AcrR family transcriptional regulator n=1 Tax=Amycolatopsis sp. NPDC098790 TaxID=3363939 RepID=UPI003824C3BB
MGRPSARDQVLDAYQEILIADGVAAVTLEAVAARAGVSKGGLLYHFGSKDALLDGLVERLLHLTEADIARAHEAPEGPLRYYLSTSVTDADMGKPAHRATIAALRLLGTDPKISTTMIEIDRRWSELLAAHLKDPAVVQVAALLGDGLYLRATLGEKTPEDFLRRLPDMLEQLDQ